MNLSEQLSRGNWLFFRNNVRAFAFKVEQVTRRKVGYHAESGEARIYNCDDDCSLMAL